MDAVRLIGATRRALARARDTQEIVTEAWQAQALAEAVGGSLAINGPPETRAEGRSLSEAGGRAHGDLHRWVARVGAVRAAQLSAVQDPRRALQELGALLGEVGVALVAVACSADEEGVYWQCVEGIDAADESGDRVRGLLRRLAAREVTRDGSAGDPGSLERGGRTWSWEGPVGTMPRDGREKESS